MFQPRLGRGEAPRLTLPYASEHHARTTVARQSLLMIPYMNIVTDGCLEHPLVLIDAYSPPVESNELTWLVSPITQAGYDHWGSSSAIVPRLSQRISLTHSSSLLVFVAELMMDQNLSAETSAA